MIGEGIRQLPYCNLLLGIVELLEEFQEERQSVLLVSDQQTHENSRFEGSFGLVVIRPSCSDRAKH